MNKHVVAERYFDFNWRSMNDIRKRFCCRLYDDARIIIFICSPIWGEVDSQFEEDENRGFVSEKGISTGTYSRIFESTRDAWGGVEVFRPRVG
jgi:hypothetical protein